MTGLKTILVCDDEPAYLDLYREILGEAGFAVLQAATGDECLRLAQSALPDMIFLDVHLPGKSGFEICGELKKGERTQYIPLIFVTATFRDVKDRIFGFELGADDYISKPFYPDELVVRVKALLRMRELQEKLAREERSREVLTQQVAELETELRGGVPDRPILGNTTAMQRTLALMRGVRDSQAGVLILGETGTGKGLMAEAIHRTSTRRDGPFVKVDCASLPGTLLESELFGHEKGAFTDAVARRAGRFERANGGTVFLDEIGDMPLELQAKLLRVVQDSEFEKVGGDAPIKVDVRIIAATNVDLERAVEARTFRKDLYYRLNVIQIVLPPLRARMDDVPILANHFLAQYASRNRKAGLRLGADAVAKLLAYAWPGNVRELENVIERAVVLTQGDTVAADTVLLASEARGASLVAVDRPLKDLMDDVEKGAIVRALERSKGIIDGAAQILGVNRTTLYSKLKKHGIATAKKQ